MTLTQSFALSTCLLLGAAKAGEMAKTAYTAAGELIRPTGYREWIFVGANYGMGYNPEDPAKPAREKVFHNIYLQPEAYRVFASTGKFPDKTMLVMENRKAGTTASINRQGVFEDSYAGIEVALKDEQRFPEKWAYFVFVGAGGKELGSAKPMPKDRCWACHNQHGAVDNVFVQFYPVLRETRNNPTVRH